MSISCTYNYIYKCEQTKGERKNFFSIFFLNPHLAGLFHAPQLLHSWILSSHGHHRRLAASLRAPCAAAGTGHRCATEHRGRQTRSTHRGGACGTGGGGGAYLSLAAELTLLRHRCHEGTGAGGQSGGDQQRLGHFCEKFLGRSLDHKELEKMRRLASCVSAGIFPSTIKGFLDITNKSTWQMTTS